MSFPKDFIWGVSAASYQIEGAAHEEGRGLSVWDMFCRKPGAVWNGHSGDVACDHYHRYKEDVSLMKSLGVKAYRLSIAWPRILPTGTGTVNTKGLDFYDKLINELLSAGITPYVTLFHWDYPYELYCQGGWLNRCSPDWFTEYTQVVVDKLSDRVQHWMTLNEPQCFIGLGLYEGRHAPGDKLGVSEILRAAHHVLLAHGKSVQVIRARAKTPSQVGYAPVGVTKMPATDSPADVEAARQAMFSIKDDGVTWNNTWWMDPIFLGHYPEDGLQFYGKQVPTIRPGDLETIHQPLDFFGVNIYQGVFVRAGQAGQPEIAPFPVGAEQTAYDWAITPSALYWGPRFFHERYKLPIVVTENGLSSTDWVSLDGHVHDPQRIDFLSRYLLELQRAIQDGVDVRGYFQWSIMDNFEWGDGYRERFGLVFVDYQTQKRTPKDSAYWYRDLIAANGNGLLKKGPG